MIRHNRLFNPIAQMRVMDDSEFTKYIRLGDLSDWFSVSDESKSKRAEEVRERFYDAHSVVVKNRLDEVWNFVQPMIEKNPALARFILDYGGAESDYFFPWLMSVAKSPSAALEMAYGAGFDICDRWIDQVSENDNIADFVHNVPTFVYQRERQLLMADLVSSARDNGNKRRPARVVDLGAGRMAWARHHGFEFDKTSLQILAVDKDPDVNAEELFKGFSPCIKREKLDELTWIGLKYQKADILPWLATVKDKNIDLIMLGGVASYFPLMAFTEAVIKPVYNVLGEGGAFFFDLQLDCLQYEWTIKLFGWPEMELFKSAEEAISQVERTRRWLWEAGFKFSAEYAVDTPNANPSAVMIVFQKL